MSDLFMRDWAVTIDSLRLTGLRVVFKATKNIGAEPNTLDLKVYNISRSHRAALGKKGVKVIVEAGYKGNVSVVFSGDARTVDHLRDGPDWVTHVQCGDGERAYVYSRVNLSFGPGISVADVVTQIAQATGLNPGNVKDRLAGALPRNIKQFTQGFVASGKAARELSRVLRSLGMSWSIQDGAIQVLKDDRDTASNTAVLLNSQTGLVGSPDHGSPDKKGKSSVLKVRSLLQPKIKPGSKLKIESSSANGFYRCEKVEHNGDSAGQEWYTNAEARVL
jgi:hypothetical protein